MDLTKPLMPEHGFASAGLVSTENDRRGNDFSLGGAKIERLFGRGSKNWSKTIKTIKFKV